MAEKLDFAVELDKLENSLEELKVQFEQHFMGMRPLAPNDLLNQVKRSFRRLRKAPFRNSQVNFRLHGLEGRYHIYNMYWERVLKQRDEGTYHRDLFKADLREKIALEEQQAETREGKAEKHMHQLFDSYCSALEANTGKKQELNYDAFRRSLVQRAKEIKSQHGVKKVSFKVKIKDGKVTVLAKAK